VPWISINIGEAKSNGSIVICDAFAKIKTDACKKT
jgi:hypothetical protein